ncbi:MAG: recombinase family protein [Terrimonas sp.]|nr:recombinase family protein [Terrimonas sp.]OJY80734.1 MAG: hypothetical protein BGP13_00065 [Sphingobacteriales bacterium 40-81]
MSTFDYFQKFIPKESAVTKNELFVWIYTRVSSKDQFEQNSSVENQLTANRTYAAKFNYRVTEEFGGTYESAKSDFTRKEFSRLISKVKASRKKPYAILVYKMSRFSRSGGNAIGLVNRLVEESGVHLIEVCSGISTTTERGKVVIYESLFHAYKENLERKEILIPSMVAYIQKGYRLGVTPFGYDHYGPRVRNEMFFRRQQKIVINKDGELLRQAWQWKASGLYSDVQIIQKLAVRGLRVRPQKLSRIWRTPFYCGININRMLDEPVKGNWEPLITKHTFIKVQQLLEKNHSGYQHKKENVDRPLSRLLKCNNCDNYLVGYMVQKKGLHYYRCLRCKGVSLNASTTLRSRRRGAHDMFLDLLGKYCIPNYIVSIIELQLIKLFNHYHNIEPGGNHLLESQLKALEEKKKTLQIRFGLGEVNREIFDITLQYLAGQIQAAQRECKTALHNVSGLEKLLDSSQQKLKRFSGLWESCNLDNKKRIQRLLFPEGVFYELNNHEYIIRKVNDLVTEH